MGGLNSMTQTIIIRQAQPEDNKEIWDILHANCRTWTLQQIQDNNDGMFVLTKGYKILGVLFGSFDMGKKTINWVEVHPLYPEKVLMDVIIKGLLGTLQPDVEERRLQKIVNKQLSPIW